MRAVMSVRTAPPVPVREQPAIARVRAAAASQVVVRISVLLLDRLLGALLHDLELDAAVLLATLGGVVGGDRHVGAEALRGQASPGDALADEVLAHRLGAVLRQRAV